MSSPSALLYDTYYHIYNRGVNRENIFVEERNYEHFLKLYERHLSPVTDLFAYCLLRNHFHLLVRVKSEEEILETLKQTLKVSAPGTKHAMQGSAVCHDEKSPGKPLGFENHASRQFANFFNAYAKSINKAYERTGSLFQHPFGRVPVTNDRQFWNAIAYIHQNPQKHRFVDDFRDWKYSSYGVLISDKPSFIQREAVLNWFGTKQEYLDRHKDWVTEAQSKWFAGDDYD